MKKAPSISVNGSVRPVLLALIASIAPTILAIAVLATSIRTSRKADVIITKADEIHTLTNSNLTEVTSDLDSVNRRIQKLEQMLIDREAAHLINGQPMIDTLKPSTP